MKLIDIIAFLGMSLLLIAFFLNALHKVKNDGAFYQGLNLVGGSIMAYYSWAIKSFPFFLLQTSWALVALFGLISFFYKKNTNGSI